MQYDSVIDFWFKALTPQAWWQKSNKIDQEIASQFSGTHQQATQGELYPWRSSAEGRLAEIIVLDQFSRNLYRSSPQSFAYDGMALTLAQEAIANKFDQALPADQRAFLYMPFMHSESKLIHQQAVKLLHQPGLEKQYEFELKHKVIIDRFGRYPHRNEVLGRRSTIEELQFLKEPDSSF